MNGENYYDEAIRYLAEDMSKKERAEFEQFLEGDPLRKDELEVLKRVWKKTAVYDSSPPKTDVHAQWQRFSDVAFDSKAEVIKVNFWWRRALRVAAAVLLLAVSVFTWRLVQKPASLPYAEIMVSVDQGQKMVTLPDGSKVWLNANSEIKYDSLFERRIVSLVGEGYFEVEHLESDAPFKVLAGEAETTVLGTSFNVRAYPGETEVSVDVFEGKVALKEVASAEAVILEKGQGAAYHHEERSVTSKSPTHANIASWKTRELKFADDKLSKVLMDLNRVYGAEFTVQDEVVLDCTFQSDFSDEELEDVLDAIMFSLNLSIEKHPTTEIWTVSGKGCLVEQ